MSGPAIGFLVGPGVIDHLGGLHAAAAAMGVAVLNTWGAKGVFPWDSSFHAGTVGLQARDFELAGLGAVDRLYTSGLDPDEVTSTPWIGRAEVIDIEPAELHRFAAAWPDPPATPARSPFYDQMAAVVSPLYADPTTPASRARHLAQTLPDGGVVVAGPGLAGFWVARTFPTASAGTVVVPAVPGPGVGAATAARLAADGRDVLYVTDRADDTPSGVRIERWDELDLTLPVALLDLAGPIVAWGGLAT